MRLSVPTSVAELSGSSLAYAGRITGLGASPSLDGTLTLKIADPVRMARLAGIEDPLINFAGEALPQFHDYLYFSFVTVTTLGYGDITPANALAKSIVIVIAISGQLYLTVLVAMLVGKYLSIKQEKT